MSALFESKSELFESRKRGPLRRVFAPNQAARRRLGTPMLAITFSTTSLVPSLGDRPGTVAILAKALGGMARLEAGSAGVGC
jgi:hypothetical protein